MTQLAAFVKTVVVLLALAACVCAQSPPPQDSAAPKTEARKRVVNKLPTELEAAVTTRVAPIIPAIAKWAGESGAVTVQVLINEQGEVIDAHSQYGPALLTCGASAITG